MHVCLSDRSHRVPSDAPSPHGHSHGDSHVVSFRRGIRLVTPLLTFTIPHLRISTLFATIQNVKTTLGSAGYRSMYTSSIRNGHVYSSFRCVE